MSLLDLVEKDDRERLAADLLRELTALVVADVAGRSTEEARGRVLLRELGHIELDKGILVTEEELGEGLGQLGLTHAGRAGEDERATGTVRILQTRARTTDRLGESLDGLVLTDDALVQLVFHLEQLRGLGLGEAHDRDTGRHGQDLGDLLIPDLGDLVGLAALPGLFLRLALLGQLRLLVAQRRGLLEVLIVDGRLLVAAHLGDLLVQLAQLRRRGHAADAQARAGLVDQVDRLVGEETIRDVAVRQLGGSLDRGVRDDDAVVRLVAVAQALEDLHRLVDAGLLDLHRLEAALEGRVLLDVLAVLVVRGGADRLEFAARQHGLEHLSGINRALGGTRTHEGVDLVDEQDDVAARADLLEDLLQALLEVATVARAGDQRPHVEAVDLLVLDRLGHVAVHDRLSEALDDRGLTDAGLTDQHRVVLRAAREDLHDALHLDAAADHGVQLVLARGLRQVAAELLEDRGVGALGTTRAAHTRAD